MVRLMAILVTLLVFEGCATARTPTASPSSSAAPLPAVRCVGVPETEPDVCGQMVALVRQTHPHEVSDGSRILVVDSCAPQVLCDRFYMYDSAVIVVPGDGNAANALALHVFGHQGESLSIEPWTGPLPAHVAPLLAEA